MLIALLNSMANFPSQISCRTSVAVKVRDALAVAFGGRGLEIGGVVVAIMYDELPM
ncbi:hypothetical protein E2C01_049042 [Portunus trituberculatus]|uniref:Uncharacterized protein n=1 Tax=Portunus trituberculatus TaxID=210409 RepID=A0A5B7GD56_PORTR|nr:hypothetical protein [Portunus trituberculatus]